MTKKKSAATVVVAEPEVQNNINMNLTHNDIIDVAIQTQLEILEPREEELRKMILSTDEEIKRTHDEVLTKATERAGFCKEAAAFHKALAAIDRSGKIEPKILERYPSGNNESICSDEYLEFRGCDPEDSKTPIQYFKRNVCMNILRQIISRGISFKLTANLEDGLTLTTSAPCRIELTEREYNAYKAKIKGLLDKKVNLYKEWYEAKKQVLELRYDEKKVKARVVKMSLANTKQGKEILELLEKSTNVKLLS